MLNRVFGGGTLRVAIAAFAVSLAVAPTAFAKGWPDNNGDHDNNRRVIPNCSRGHDDDDDDNGGGRGPHDTSCPGKQVLVRVDEKTCPDKPNRPATIVKRVCCKHHDITFCHPFHPCPPRSPS